MCAGDHGPHHDDMQPGRQQPQRHSPQLHVHTRRGHQGRAAHVLFASAKYASMAFHAPLITVVSLIDTFSLARRHNEYQGFHPPSQLCHRTQSSLREPKRFM
jgi:hypothetical protein